MRIQVTCTFIVASLEPNATKEQLVSTAEKYIRIRNAGTLMLNSETLTNHEIISIEEIEK